MSERHKPSISYDESLAKSSLLAQAFTELKDDLSSADSLSQRRKRIATGLSHQLIELTRNSLMGGFSLDELGSFRQSALGFTREEVGETFGLTPRTVYQHNANAKKYLGANSLPQAVVLGVQKGYLEVDTSPNVFEGYLTPLQWRILCNYAHGRSLGETSAFYGLEGATIVARQLQLREKLRARNISHLMLRAFELGIFDHQSEIPDPCRDDSQISVMVNGALYDLQAAKLNRPNVIELLKNLKDLDKGSFGFDDIEHSDFISGATKRGRQILFSRSAYNLGQSLNELAGGKVVEMKMVSDGKHKKSKFAIRAPVSIIIEGINYELPIFEGQLGASQIKIPTRKKITTTQKKPAAPKANQPTDKSVPPNPSLETPPPVKENYAYIKDEDLPEMTEEFISSLRPRPRKEIKDNFQLQKELKEVAVNGNLCDYRTRVVMHLRYGVPIPAKMSDLLFRAGKYYKLSEILSPTRLKPFVGLGLSDTSKLSGYTELAILETELEFIEKNATKDSALAANGRKIRAKIREIEAKKD